MSDQQTLSGQGALALAVQHFSAGRLAEAERLCQQILQQTPDQPTVLHLLGVISHQMGKNDSAVDLIRKALDINPDLAEAHYHLAVILQNIGRLEEAVRRYGKLLELQPGHAEAHNNLGNALQKLARPEEAVASFQQALAAKPDYAEAHNNLGLALRDLGRLDAALASYNKALAIKPDYAEAHANIGLVRQDLGQLEEAVASYRQALGLMPGHPMMHNNLGTALLRLGELDAAMACYQKALEIKPDLAEAHNNLGNALQDLGKRQDAVARYREAVTLAPDNELFWANLAASMRSMSFSSADDGLYRDLLRLLERPAVPPAYITRAAISALRQQPDFSRIETELRAIQRDNDIAYSAIAGELAAMPLFARVLELSPVPDQEIERMLTILRREMLAETMAGKTAPQALPFSAALAHHCFTNEYVFAESAAETEAVEQLQQQIAALVEQGREVPPALVAALGAYRPLFEFPWAQQLGVEAWGNDIKGVIRRQITEPLEERALRSGIAAVTAIEDGVSQSVRAQYEENPYPRWTKAGLAHKSGALGAVLRGAPLFFDLADDLPPGRPQILMAGCGTGQHTLYMNSRFSDAEVLAVDLSLSSLSYAARKTKELGLTNIEYAHGDILELAQLERQFDLIGCAGVLHHLADPMAGWQVLTDLLRPGGVMKIGLYSETARRHLAAGRALIAEKGYAATPEDIRQCRQDIFSLAAEGDSEMAKICHGEDFFSLSRCRDLLFHVQEHRFTLAQIEAALETLGLTFLGFEMDDRQTLATFKQSHPEPGALTSLPRWHEYEREHPATFSGMYQFWCRKL